MSTRWRHPRARGAPSTGPVAKPGHTRRCAGPGTAPHGRRQRSTMPPTNSLLAVPCRRARRPTAASSNPRAQPPAQSRNRRGVGSGRPTGHRRSRRCWSQDRRRGPAPRRYAPPPTTGRRGPHRHAGGRAPDSIGRHPGRWRGASGRAPPVRAYARPQGACGHRRGRRARARRRGARTGPSPSRSGPQLLTSRSRPLTGGPVPAPGRGRARGRTPAAARRGRCRAWRGRAAAAGSSRRPPTAGGRRRAPRTAPW